MFGVDVNGLGCCDWGWGWFCWKMLVVVELVIRIAADISFGWLNRALLLVCWRLVKMLFVLFWAWLKIFGVVLLFAGKGVVFIPVLLANILLFVVEVAAGNALPT